MTCLMKTWQVQVRLSGQSSLCFVFVVSASVGFALCFSAPLVPQVAPVVVVKVAPQLVFGGFCVQGLRSSSPTLAFFASQLVRVLRSEFDSSSPTLVAVMFAEDKLHSGEV